MSDRTSGRHRAVQRPRTPLDSLTDTLTGQLSAVSDHLGSVGRSGAVLAVSTGLVASVALPAAAVSKAAPGGTPAEAGASAVSAAAVALPASVTNGAAVSAARTASVDFERDAITVAAKPKAKPKPKKRSVERSSRSSERRGSTSGSVRGGSVLSIARQFIGLPYVYGGTTPDGFDCSGFTQYVFRKAGISLPRTSGQQYAATRRISRSQAHAGDLVFIFTGGRVTHVGIYLGGNRMIDSPRTGKSIQEREIWSSNIAFGRP